MNDEVSYSIIESIKQIIEQENITHHIVGGKIYSNFVEINSVSSLIVVGDIHGDLSTLEQILDKIDFVRFLSNPYNKMIFLGDYVDRGQESFEVVYRLFYLKYRFPDSVILLRGNHEAISKFPFKSYSFINDVERRFGKRVGKKIHDDIISIFEKLPIMVEINSIFLLMHGGLPTGTSFSKCKYVLSHNLINNRIIKEILWNDPRIILNGKKDWENSRRLCGKHFGLSITRRWIEESNVRVIIRGHEPCMGFRLDHEDLILTLFSSKKPYPKFKAAYLILGKNDFHQIQNAKSLIPFIRILKNKKIIAYNKQ